MIIKYGEKEQEQKIHVDRYIVTYACVIQSLSKQSFIMLLRMVLTWDGEKDCRPQNEILKFSASDAGVKKEVRTYTTMQGKNYVQNPVKFQH